MKKMMFLFALISMITLFISFSYKGKTEKLVGVIVPIEHQALTEIVKGLKEKLGLESDSKILVKVMNAQGDLTIQRAIIEQLVRDQCDVLVPIGNAASQMTVALSKEHPIICLAADLNVESTQAACLTDQLSVQDSLSFLQTAFPKIHKITLLHSSSEKIASDIPSALEAARSRGIQVQQLMVQSLAELYTVGQAIADDSQAIFILKDNLIVSGIQTVIQQAEKRHIPVMTSDEGSIIAGGAFAIGIKESDIGRQGAKMVQMVLNGISPQDLASQTMGSPKHLMLADEDYSHR
ncbi:MAG: ABC transporter substrate binding protein [Rhabdochlamydiaceae bacterium]